MTAVPKRITIGFCFAVLLSLALLYIHFAYENGHFPFKPELVCKQFHLINHDPLPTATSPDGEWTAEINVEGCGKNHDHLHEYLTLHPTNEKRDISRQGRIFEIGDVGHPTVRWSPDRTLEVVFESIVEMEGLNLPNSYNEIPIDYMSRHGEKLLEPTQLGAYGLTSTYCGKERAPEDAATIPSLGCFYLSAGHSATGQFSGHKVEIAVNTAGQETFTVDGVLINDNHGKDRTTSGTNLPLVHVFGSGYSFCETASQTLCPSDVSIFSRNPDRSVLFIAGKCLTPQHVCVTTQENIDYLESHPNSR